MLIRNWQFSDIPALVSLEEQCFSTDRWSLNTFTSLFGRPTFFAVVAAEDDEIIAYGGVTVAADTADLENILVAQLRRCNGVGSAVLEKLVSIARERGASQIFLEVRVDNAPAIALYKKHGFEIIYSRRNYYSDGADCFVMQKNL